MTPDLAPEDRFKALDDVRDRASIEAKRQKWREGRTPDSYEHRLPFIHAKSCLYALDTLQKSLEVLAALSSAPAEVEAALAEFETAVPSLKHVRDSSHHAEDRVQGKKRKERIDLQPVTNSAIHAPGRGVLIVDMLNNNRYGGTLADGTYGEVEVSVETVSAAQQAVQRVLSAYAWAGPPTHMPR